MKIYMKYKKETKNKFVFTECTQDGGEVPAGECSIPSLYIAKHAIKEPTRKIIVDIRRD